MRDVCTEKKWWVHVASMQYLKCVRHYICAGEIQLFISFALKFLAKYLAWRGIALGYCIWCEALQERERERVEQLLLKEAETVP